MKVRIIASIIGLMVAVQVMAIPAMRGISSYRQPDGSVVQYVVRGDEFTRVRTTLDGCAIVLDKDGYYCYAAYDFSGRRRNSGVRVGAKDPEAARAMREARRIPYGQVAQRGAKARSEARATQTRAAGRTAAAVRAGIEARDARPGARKGGAGAVTGTSGAGAVTGTSGAVTAAGASGAVTRGEMTGETRGEMTGVTRGEMGGTKKMKVAVILAEFPDLKFKATWEDFDALLNSRDYKENGATGSAYQYFTDQFEGTIDFEFVVTKPVMLSKGFAYYGKNNDEGEDENPRECVAEACRLADAQLDYSEFDYYGNGEVSCVFVFVAGEDEAHHASEDHLWSHMWCLDKTLILDGKKIYTYALSTEYSGTGSSRYFTTIGSFCHEFSHCLGLYDLYDTDYADSEGCSEGADQFISLMDYGNYNNSGKTPPNYNAMELETFGLGSKERLAGGTNVLKPLSEEKRYFRAETDKKDEYFLFECRYQEGWDKYISGSGMLIYHIDRSNNDAGLGYTAYDRWYGEATNRINAYPPHLCADIEEADPNAAKNISGLLTRYHVDGTLFSNSEMAAFVSRIFWPNGQNNAFTPNSDPPYRFWSGNFPEVTITGIRKSGHDIIFQATGPLSLESVEAFQDAAIILWTMTAEGNGRITLTDSNGNTRTQDVEPFDTGRFSCIFENLEPKQTYKVTISNPNKPDEFIKTEFTTKAFYSDGYPFIYLNSADRESDGAFRKGSRLPLRVFNARGAADITWYFQNNVLSTDGSGYWYAESSGTIQAVIDYLDGTRDIIQKTITVR